MFVAQPPSWGTGLDADQVKAVEHPGPVLVVAGAGSGKTRTLAARVARLLTSGVDPDRVLLLTFSRRAAKEMLHRADAVSPARATARVWGGTFHAVAVRVLREHAPAVGLSNSFNVLDQGDAVDLIGVIRGELGLSARDRRFPRKETVLDIYSRVVNAQEPLTDVLRERFPWCGAELDDLRALFEGYVERKRSRGLLDFDDLLLYWRALVSSSPAAPLLRGRFDHVLVDEYQDTNRLQADILSGLCPDGAGLFVVGDDAQAIYGFRAASAANLGTFTERFPRADVITLDRNYRSLQPILDAANSVMTAASGVFPKNLRAVRTDPGASAPLLVQADDEATQAAFVCERVLEHREDGVDLRDQAVLFRTGHHSVRLELELSRRNIPFVKYGGLRFLEAAHVKDLLAFLRLLENPSDELAWHRILAMVEGIGPVTAQRVLEHLTLPNPAALRVLVDDPPEVPSRARTDLDLVRAALADCLDVARATPGPAVEIEAIRTQLRPLFERRYQDAGARLADLEQLQAIAASSPARSHFLAELTIDPPSRTSDLAGPPHLDDDYLVLSTIHSAKGDEWTVVFVIHAADGNIPSDMAISTKEGVEEERRLLYVALTRARDHLYVTYPLRFYDRRFATDDVHSYAQPSRFLAPARHRFREPDADEAHVLRARPSVPDGPDRVTEQLSSLWG